MAEFKLEPKFKKPPKPPEDNKPVQCTFFLRPELVLPYRTAKQRLGYKADEFLNAMVGHCLKELGDA